MASPERSRGAPRSVFIRVHLWFQTTSGHPARLCLSGPAGQGKTSFDKEAAPRRAAGPGGSGNQVDLEVLIENVLNALAAGITIGCIYGLMCIGLGLIFGIMRIVNFAQGELLMLGMYASLYLVTGAGVFAFLGPYVGPFIGALCAGPIVFVGGALLHRFLIARVSGLRTAGTIDDGHFGQLLVTLGISLILQNGGLIVFGSTPETVRTPLASRAFEVTGFYGDATVF